MFRIGHGSDVHRLIAGRRLVIGGVTISSDLGAEGHSDADVLLHAVTDAILGALALGDIGTHFPDSSERWKDSPSTVFLESAAGMMSERGYSLVNLDATVHLEGPKLRPHIPAMAEILADALKADVTSISIKAKTGEGVDAVGERRAVRAEATVLLRGG
jgi:2-C-methyl-D-erythritol 2,4-cyclodiphosphate synthase